MAVYETRIASLENTAVMIVNELIERGFENPTSTPQYLRLVARCLITLCDPKDFLRKEDGEPDIGETATQF